MTHEITNELLKKVQKVINVSGGGRECLFQLHNKLINTYIDHIYSITLWITKPSKNFTVRSHYIKQVKLYKKACFYALRPKS